MDLRCPNTAAASAIGVTVAAIINDQKFVFTLVDILEVVEFGLKSPCRTLTWNVPLFGSEFKLNLKDVLQCGELLLHVQVIFSPTKEQDMHSSISRLRAGKGIGDCFLQILRKVFEFIDVSVIIFVGMKGRGG